MAIQCLAIKPSSRQLTLRIWQVRFWDIASGEEVRQVALSRFAFAPKGKEMLKLKTDHHFIKARNDTLEISALLPHGVTVDIDTG